MQENINFLKILILFFIKNIIIDYIIMDNIYNNNILNHIYIYI